MGKILRIRSNDILATHATKEIGSKIRNNKYGRMAPNIYSKRFKCNICIHYDYKIAKSAYSVSIRFSTFSNTRTLLATAATTNEVVAAVGIFCSSLLNLIFFLQPD